MGKKAIVTGGTGFIGSHLCRKLLSQGWQVSVITRPLSDYINLKGIMGSLDLYEHNGDISCLTAQFRRTNADVVFHLASLFIAEHKPNDIDDLVDSNLRFGLHVLEAMKGSGIGLLVNTGTSWQHYHTNEYNPVDLYAATKEAFEKLITYYVEAEGLRTVTLKLFETYGEDDQRHKLINELTRLATEQRQIDLSPGDQFLDLVHVDDVTNAFLQAYNYLSGRVDVRYEEFGVGTENLIRLRDLVSIFETVTNKKINITWGGREYRKREVMAPWRGFRTVPNWKCNIDLIEGLSKYRNDQD